MTETDLQRDAVKFLRLVLGRYYLVTHHTNEGRRSRIAGGILREQGMQAGVADICITGNRFAAYIELKVGKRELSPAQEAFRDECRQKSIPWALCRSLDEVSAVVVAWGLVRESDDLVGSMRAVPPDELPAMGGDAGSLGQGRESGSGAAVRRVPGQDRGE